MKEQISEIQNLNDICRRNRYGIYKQWIYKKEDYMKMCDYMQKINYSIQDLNSTIEDLKEFNGKNVVYIISLVDWIREAFNAIINVINPIIIKDFHFSKQADFKKHTNYFKAIRSFIVAHPLKTDQHEQYGFDGNYICVDIRDNVDLFPLPDRSNEYSVSISGLRNKMLGNEDFYLFCYSDKDDNMKYFKKIGCRYADIFDTARLYIDKLYELDKYLVKNIKRKDYE